MANCFICHRKADREQAERLAHHLSAAGHTIWFDEWAIAVGDSIVERIDQGLAGSHYLILGYSGAGISAWVNREWMSTLARQLDGHAVKILPVLLSAGGAPPALLADLRYADLVTQWDRALQELLQAIR